VHPLRFDSVFYYVRALDRSIAFYRDLLGFELRSRDVVARFEIDGVLFELVPTGDDSLLSGKGNARLVLTTPDLESTLRELQARNVPVSDLHVVEGGQLATLDDPDGNEIVLWQYASRPTTSTSRSSHATPPQPACDDSSPNVT
jgi:lactoylglutathione lyase